MHLCPSTNYHAWLSCLRYEFSYECMHVYKCTKTNMNSAWSNMELHCARMHRYMYVRIHIIHARTHTSTYKRKHARTWSKHGMLLYPYPHISCFNPDCMSVTSGHFSTDDNHAALVRSSREISVPAIMMPRFDESMRENRLGGMLVYVHACHVFVCVFASMCGYFVLPVSVYVRMYARQYVHDCDGSI
jgi:hypothetical protein